MKNHTFIVKEPCDIVNLEKNLGREAEKEMRKIGKKMSWLCYAKRIKYSYRPLRNKKAQYQILNTILDKVTKKYPQFTKGQISDILSDLVNNTVKTDAISRGLKLIDNDYIRKYLIEIVSSSLYVPNHPWFYPLKKIQGTRWQAKDLLKGKIVEINKKKKDGFFQFDIFYL